MEFPCTGVRCTVKECKQLDFLPYNCSYCTLVFCKNHFHVTSHSCSKFVNNIVTETKKSISFKCVQNSCSNKSSIELLCTECKKHFCLLHRYHGCLEQTKEQKLKELKNWENPKKEFLEAKSIVDKEITNKLKKSKNSTMANKIQLMKLKGKSIGSNNIPIVERRYFMVHLPMNESINIQHTKGAFVSVEWSIGKVIDSIAELLNIPNSNNVADAKKLRMYNYSTGNIISHKMDTLLCELLNNGSLIDGQDVILEYSCDDNIDCSMYK